MARFYPDGTVIPESEAEKLDAVDIENRRIAELAKTDPIRGRLDGLLQLQDAASAAALQNGNDLAGGRLLAEHDADDVHRLLASVSEAERNGKYKPLLDAYGVSPTAAAGIAPPVLPSRGETVSQNKDGGAPIGPGVNGEPDAAGASVALGDQLSSGTGSAASTSSPPFGSVDQKSSTKLGSKK